MPKSLSEQYYLSDNPRGRKMRELCLMQIDWKTQRKLWKIRANLQTVVRKMALREAKIIK